MVIKKLRGFPRLLVVAFIALVMFIPAFLVSFVSNASAIDCAYCRTGKVYGSSGWAGSYNANIGGHAGVVYCIEEGKWYAQGDYTHLGTNTSDAGMRMGYLLYRWGETTDEQVAVSLAMLANKYIEGNSDKWNAFPQYQAYAQSLWDQAGMDGGPYRLGGQITQQADADNGYVAKIQIWVIGRGGDLSDSYSFPQESIQPTELFNVETPTVSRDANNVFTISAKVVDPQQSWNMGARTVNTAGGVDWWSSSVSAAQDVISAAIQRSGDPIKFAGAASKYQPSATSVTSARLVSAGASLTDTVRVSDGRSGDSFSGASVLYGPFDSNDEALNADVSGLEAVGRAEFSGTYGADGSASVSTGAVTVSEPGFYTWVESLDETDKALGFTQDKATRAPEVSLVPDVRITSQISAKRLDPGGQFSDAVQVSGLTTTVGDQAITWTLTGGLYGPVAVDGATGSCDAADFSDAQTVDTVTRVIENAEINDQGVASLQGLLPVTPEASGFNRCFSYGWSVTGSTPDGSSVAFAHAAGDPTQTGIVLFQPAITTTVSDQIVSDLPGELSDTVNVSGGVAGASFKGSTSLYGPFDTDEQAQTADVDGMTPIATRTFSGTYGDDGTAQLTVDAVTVDEPGFYTWIESLSETGDGGKAVEASKDRRAPETSVALTPGISSLVDAKRLEADTVSNDSIMLTGLAKTVGTEPIVWTLTGGLYGPVNVDSETGSCEAADFSNASLANSQTLTVDNSQIDGDGNVTVTASDTPTVDGSSRCFSWGWRLTGTAPDGSTVSVNHAAGDPAQTGVVTFQPSVATVVSDQIVSDLPGELSDTVNVSGGVAGASFKGSTSLYGPFATDEQAQTADVDGMTAIATRSFSGTYGSDGTAQLTVDAVAVDEPGFYTWIESLSETGDGGKAVEASKDRRAPETSVALTPGISSLVDAKRLEADTVSNDSIMLTGLAKTVGTEPIVWTLTGGLYGPVNVDSETGSCEAADFSNASLANSQTLTVDNSQIDADGNVTVTASDTPTVDGSARCFSWGWHLTGTAPDGSSITVDHAAGDPAQTGVVTFNPKVSTQTASQLSDGSGLLSDTVRVWDGVEGLKFSGRTALYGPFKTNDEALNADLGGAVIGVDTGNVSDDTEPLTTEQTVSPSPSPSVSPSASGLPGGLTNLRDRVLGAGFVGDDGVLSAYGTYTFTDEAGVHVLSRWPGDGDYDFVSDSLTASNIALSSVTPILRADYPLAEGQEAPEDVVRVLSLVVVMEFEGIYGADGTAEFVTDGVEISEPGFYVWVEELDATGEGGNPNPADKQRRVPETTVLLTPEVGTQISDQSAERGSTISDSVKLSGLETLVGDSEVSWKVQVRLYGPVEPNRDGSCEAVDWSDAQVVLSEDHAVDNAAVDANGELILDGVGVFDIPAQGQRGCYTYGETLTGSAPDGSTVTVTHEPGLPTQTTLVPFAGLITTGSDTTAPIVPGGRFTVGLAVAGSALITAGLLLLRRRKVRV